MLRSTALLVGLYLGLPSACGLRVTPGSPCTTACLSSDHGEGLSPGSSTTTVSEISCQDYQYHSTEEGKRFASCNTCLQSSTWSNGTESDVAWFIYNLRFTIGACLFNVPGPVDDSDEAEAGNKEQDSEMNSRREENSQGSCATESTCIPFKEALVFDQFDSTSIDPYAFCDADNEAFMKKSLDPCVKCLRGSDQQAYMANFILALSGGCYYKPLNGSRLHLVGDLFSKREVSVSAANVTDSSDGNRESDSASGTSPTKPMSKGQVGMISGITGGASILLCGTLFLFCRRYRGRKRGRSRAPERNPIFPPPMPEKSFISSRPRPHYDPYQKDPQYPQPPQSPQHAKYQPHVYAQFVPEYGLEYCYVEFEESETSAYTSKRNTMLPSGLPVHPAYIPTIRSRPSLSDSSLEDGFSERGRSSTPSRAQSIRTFHGNPSTSSLPQSEAPAPTRSQSTSSETPSIRRSRAQRVAPIRTKSRKRSKSRSRPQPLAGHLMGLDPPDFSTRSLQATPEKDSFLPDAKTPAPSLKSPAPSVMRSPAPGSRSAMSPPPSHPIKSALPASPAPQVRFAQAEHPVPQVRFAQAETPTPPSRGSQSESPAPSSRSGLSPPPAPPARSAMTPSPAPSDSGDPARGRRKNRPNPINLPVGKSSSTKNIKRLPTIDPSPRI